MVVFDIIEFPNSRRAAVDRENRGRRPTRDHDANDSTLVRRGVLAYVRIETPREFRFESGT